MRRYEKHGTANDTRVVAKEQPPEGTERGKEVNDGGNRRRRLATVAGRIAWQESRRVICATKVGCIRIKGVHVPDWF